MNVLILTPDRVGSTFLQRTLTIYMTTCNLDKAVINLHELTNGLESYFSDVFNQFVLGKPGTGVGGGDQAWGYYQTLPEIVELLDKADHYKTSRLAHYHLVRRDDPKIDQTNFYQYLNDNFYIIACQRKNVFEQSLSWGINSISKTLNVYSHEQKIETYAKLYKNKITIPPQTLIKHLDDYKNYINWTKIYFNVNDFFIYEDDLPNIENYVRNLDIFTPDVRPKKWESMFGLSFNDWNKCHKLVSDITFNNNMKLLEGPNNSKQLPSIRQISQSLPAIEQEFLYKHSKEYVTSLNHINELVEHKVLVTGVPIKLQTLAEKKMIVKNFDELLETYNDWANNNDYETIDESEIIDNAKSELQSWYASSVNMQLLN